MIQINIKNIYFIYFSLYSINKSYIQVLTSIIICG